MVFSIKQYILLIVCVFNASIILGQSTLERISTAKRADGKGIVVRFHLDGKLSSYELSQPTSSLVQLAINEEFFEVPIELNTTVYHKPVEDIALVKKNMGYGINLFLAENSYVLAEAYPDASSDDLLIALNYTSQKVALARTKGVELKEWVSSPSSTPILNTSTSETEPEKEPKPVDPFELALTSTEEASNYDAIRDKVKFDVVVIDPGHGGKDPGALGYKKTKEKDIALDVALKLGKYINEYLPDVKVVFTRDDDRFIGLSERGQIANKAEGDLFISLHCNAFRNRKVNGTEVFFLGMHRSESAKEVMLRENSVVQYEMESEQKTQLSEEDLAVYELMHNGFISSGQQFAFSIDQQFTQRVHRPSRGVKQAGFVVLWHTAMPSVLVELGFISNPKEEKYLNSEYGQTMLASALFRAVRDYKVALEKNQHLTQTTNDSKR